MQHTTYWGLGAVVFMYIIHPPVEKLISVIPTNIAYIALGIILFVFIIDLLNAVRVASDFRKLMDALHSLTETARKRAENAKELINKSGKHFADITEEINETVQEKVDLLKKSRLFHYSPNLKHKAEQEFLKFKNAVEELKEKIKIDIEK